MMVLGCVLLALLTLGAIGEGGRRRAKEFVCRANLRQWGGIFQGYIEQNDGKFLSGDPGTPGYWWPKQLSEEHRDWKRTRIWFCPEADKPIVDEYGKVAPTLSIFNAWGIFAGSGLGPNGISGSYGLNGYVIPIAENRTFESGIPAKHGWGDLHDVPEASSVPMFLEALRFDLWPRFTDAPAANEFALWTGNNLARCCINRHDGAVNCLFVDGSVRKVGLKELWTLKWHKSFNTAGPWTKAGGVLPQDWPQWIRPFKEY
jgi:prepilin-type processing-associated H-X9-DG protein